MRHPFAHAAALALALALAACGGSPQGAPESVVEAPPATPSPAINVEVAATGLAFPWGMDVLPDGRLLITEKAGQLRVFENGALLNAPIAGAPEVLDDGQGGLLDVAAHPNFADNSLIYLSYAAGTQDANATHLARARLNGQALSDLEVIFTAQPEKRGGAHFGGRILFLPDGTLLLSLGDGYDYRNKAQDLDNHFGKIVRLNDDGSTPAGNPFATDAGALATIYSYGHRNVQGLARDPVSGRIYEAEFGPRGGDELNLLEPGNNYGWPAITYGVDYSGATISPLTEREGMEQPLAYWVPSISPSGIAFYSGDLFEAWRGDVLMANLSGQHLRRVDLNADGEVVGQEALLADRNARLRDVQMAPDGSVYVLTDAAEAELWRLTPTQ